jgi:hypothetical protein
MYVTAQTVTDHGPLTTHSSTLAGRNTILGPTDKKDGFEDPLVDMQKGFLFQKEEAFIRTMVDLQSTMTFSFWINVVNVGKLTPPPSRLFLFRMLTQNPLYFEQSK